jgi:integrase
LGVGWNARDTCRPPPLVAVRLPLLGERQLRPLTEEEERKLLSTCDENNSGDCRTKAIFLLMLDTGLRLSEV